MKEFFLCDPFRNLILFAEGIPKKMPVMNKEHKQKKRKKSRRENRFKRSHCWVGD
jgi:hypothetical protein